MAEKKIIIQSDEEKERIVMALRPIDDILFEVLISDPGVCQEFLQAVMENPRLRIKEDTLEAQKSIRNLARRSVRLDAYVEGNGGTTFTIEIQRADKENHVKRVRFIASAATVHDSNPGEDFEDVRNVCVIYVSEFDVFRKHRMIYHIHSVIGETGDRIEDGLEEIFIDTENTDHGKIGRLIKHFKETMVQDPEFPELSRRMMEIKNSPEEVRKMCKSVQEYAEKYAEEYAEKKVKKHEKKQSREFARRLIQKGGMNDSEIASLSGLSVKEVEKLRERELSAV